MNSYLVDTTVIIEMLRGNALAKKFLESGPSISIITVGELIQGCKDKNQLQVVEKTCAIFPQIKIDVAISKITIELMKRYYLSHGLLMLDAFIGASCIVAKKTLVTNNLRDFRFIPELHILSHEEAFDIPR